jgi:hypothetical protein
MCHEHRRKAAEAAEENDQGKESSSHDRRGRVKRPGFWKSLFRMSPDPLWSPRVSHWVYMYTCRRLIPRDSGYTIPSICISAFVLFDNRLDRAALPDAVRDGVVATEKSMTLLSRLLEGDIHGLLGERLDDHLVVPICRLLTGGQRSRPAAMPTQTCCTSTPQIHVWNDLSPLIRAAVSCCRTSTGRVDTPEIGVHSLTAARLGDLVVAQLLIWAVREVQVAAHARRRSDDRLGAVLPELAVHEEGLVDCAPG